MSYATGSALTLQDLLTAIRDFALSEGWTIDKFVGSATLASNLLFLHKGQCFAAFQGGVETHTTYASGVAVGGEQDGVLYAAMSNSIDVARTVFWGHPGSLSTASNDADRVAINDLTGPFGVYHLFADASVSDHIHVVVQCGADRWQHFSFGHVDKGDLTHSGAAYITGLSRVWWRNALNVGDNNQYYNMVGRQGSAFQLNSNAVVWVNGRNCNLRIPDALPDSPNWPALSSEGLGLGHFAAAPADFPIATSGRFISPAVVSPASQWGGNVHLFPLPLLVTSAAVSQVCYVGDFPNVRALNMDGLSPGAEIDMGPDTWKVFPIVRQGPWGTQAQVGLQVSSGHYALAYKKVD